MPNQAQGADGGAGAFAAVVLCALLSAALLGHVAQTPGLDYDTGVNESRAAPDFHQAIYEPDLPVVYEPEVVPVIGPNISYLSVEVCGICLMNITDRCVLHPCMHPFDTECAMKWLNPEDGPGHVNCPICRLPVTSIACHIRSEFDFLHLDFEPGRQVEYDDDHED